MTIAVLVLAGLLFVGVVAALAVAWLRALAPKLPGMPRARARRVR